MKTFRLIPTLAILASIIFVNSCKDPVEPEPVINVTGIESTVTFQAENPEDVAFLIKTTEAWTITLSDASWLSVSPAEGSPNTSSNVTLKAEVNDKTEKRECTMTIKAGNATETYTVSQNAVVASVAVTGLDSNTIQFGPEGSEALFSMKSNVSWTIEKNNLDWCTVNPVEGPYGSFDVTVTCTSNDGDAREGTIIIKSAYQDVVVTVKQERVAPYLTADAEKIEIVSETADTSVTVSSNIDWTAVSSESWLTVSPTTGKGDNVIVAISAEANDGEARTATVTFSAEGVDSKVVTVAQAAAPFKPYIVCEWVLPSSSDNSEMVATQPYWTINPTAGTYNEGSYFIATDGVSKAEWYMAHQEPFTAPESYSRTNYSSGPAVNGVWVGDGLKCNARNLNIEVGRTLAFYVGIRSNSSLATFKIKFSFDGGNTWKEAEELIATRDGGVTNKEKITTNNQLFDFIGKIKLDKAVVNSDVIAFIYAADNIKYDGTELVATSNPTSIAKTVYIRNLYKSYNGMEAPYRGPTFVVEE